MKIFDVVQGSQEWLALRSGIPTASEFDSILTPGGKPSKSAERYLFSLLAEKMMGHPRVESVSTWMNRGSEMESEAVDFYELQRNTETNKIGFILNDEGTIGASPDRLVGSDGLLEIKCPSEAVHVSYLVKKSVDQAYYPQVQGQLWIAERKWVDILSYHPEMPWALIRVERDEDFIKLLSTAVLEFSSLLEAAANDLVKRGWITVPPAAPATGERGGAGPVSGNALSNQSSPGEVSPIQSGNVGSVATKSRQDANNSTPIATTSYGQAPHDKPLLAAWQITFFGKIAPLKKANEGKYYEVLLANGYHHANEVTSRPKALEIMEKMREAING